MYSEDKSANYSDEKRLDNLILGLAFEPVKKLKKWILKNIWLLFLMFYTAETRSSQRRDFVTFDTQKTRRVRRTQRFFYLNLYLIRYCSINKLQIYSRIFFNDN